MNTRTSTTALMVALMLSACASTGATDPAPSANRTDRSDTSAAYEPPPGYEVFDTELCYEIHRRGPFGVRLPPEKTSIRIRTLVPKARCVSISPEGWLSMVEGDCPPVLPGVASCDP